MVSLTDTGPFVIVGAGLGGLVLARALERSGRAFRVAEARTELALGGGGVVLTPRAIAALAPLDLSAELLELAEPLRELRVCSAKGNPLARVPLPVEPKTQLGLRAIGRARLAELLLAGVGSEQFRLGFQAERFEEARQEVTILTSDGRSLTGSVLVGADGLNSVVRRQLVQDGPARPAGYRAWRGVSPRSTLASRGILVEYWGRGCRFGILPLGEGQVAWFATLAQLKAADPDQLAQAFAGFPAVVAELIRSTPPADFEQPEVGDREPLLSWSSGRVTLLGDAAHPMLPELARGASEAIEDAMALAEAFTRNTRPSPAFAEYEQHRLARTGPLVERARRLGKLGGFDGKGRTWARDLGLRLTPRAALGAALNRYLSSSNSHHE